MNEDEFLEMFPDATPTAPIIRIIFATTEDKNKFLEMLSDGKVKGVKIGASESAPLFEVDDISLVFEE